MTPIVLTAAEWRLEDGDPGAADTLGQLARATAADDSLALGRSAYVARAEMTIARARRAMGDETGARAAAERAAVASAVGNGVEHPRTQAARALRDSLGS